MTERPLSVAALTQRITSALGDLGTVLVEGELSQAKVHTSGHFYATLKDGEAVISLVMWRSTVVRQGPLPADGSRVQVRGQVSVYALRGQYQLTASRITPVGAGDLAARFEALRARLTSEGLFAEARKRPLPVLPQAVGLATAVGSAALADLLHSIRARFPAMTIVVAPCQVQGAAAAASIVTALRRLERHPQVDVIICGRGGGSLEDLWAFNEEAVVRAIATCAKPVISAVGHETDTTLADFAADVRAKTPTAAGELVVPVAAELYAHLGEARERLDALIDDQLEMARRQLAALAAHRALAGPGHVLALRRQRLTEFAERLAAALRTRIAAQRAHLDACTARLRVGDPRKLVRVARERIATLAPRLLRAASLRQQHYGERLAAAAGRLDALSPLAVIARGYAVVRTAEGRVVRRLTDAEPGTKISARVGDGWIDATVDQQRPQRLGEAGDLYRV